MGLGIKAIVEGSSRGWHNVLCGLEYGDGPKKKVGLWAGIAAANERLLSHRRRRSSTLTPDLANLSPLQGSALNRCPDPTAAPGPLTSFMTELAAAAGIPVLSAIFTAVAAFC